MKHRMNNYSAALWLVLAWLTSVGIHSTPANKAALDHHYDKFLSVNLSRCATCHLPSENKDPQSLEEFPHNSFGSRLRKVRGELPSDSRSIVARLQKIASEDSDKDGVENEKELLLGHNPGDPADTPSAATLGLWEQKHLKFKKFQTSYRWRPFEPVRRPEIPDAKGDWIRNPIDSFIAAEQVSRGLKAQPEASRQALLKRVYLDLIGLLPTLAEQNAFLGDSNPDAYELLVDRLLDDPRYGERWGRHWMDVWRYSDWGGWSGGNQIRDSQPHIWRWRDWIIESLNADKPYDQMIQEMLAADESSPDDANALRATGFLARNYKMLSREQWLEDTIKHTGQAFLGLTLGCAKCHDHMYDPISQAEYYQVRAIFEPHQVRIDRVPGELDRTKNGLPRVYDTYTNAMTYFLLRGDERRPDTNRVMTPGVIHALGGIFQVASVSLPRTAAFPDKRDFVISESLAASEAKLREAESRLENAEAESKTSSRLKFEIAKSNHDALHAEIKAEHLEDTGKKESDEWIQAARSATSFQRNSALLEARLHLHEVEAALKKSQLKVAEAVRILADATAERETEKEDSSSIADRTKAADKAKKELAEAKKKVSEAAEKLVAVEKESATEPGIEFKRRPAESYPQKSTGRRLAFARWIANERNPLTSRVAVNHIWLRHFGQGIVATPADFGRNGRAPTNPKLLDWLASEFMTNGWRMKELHRLILKSSTYRMASSIDPANAAIDPDNLYLWRAPARRMEAELVRDNLLHSSGSLDPTMGGPEIDHTLGLVAKRRSVYLRSGPEKEVEFMKIFDGPAITECYVRRPTVSPQQALALHNSELTLREARQFAALVAKTSASDDSFVRDSFRRLLVREPSTQELDACRAFLVEQGKVRSHERARENLALVLMNHNDFITIR
jgi:hypothetical protein